MNDRLLHPDPVRLEAFARGELEPSEIDEVQRHLAKCQPCCDVLDEVPDDDVLALIRRAGTAVEAEEMVVAGNEQADDDALMSGIDTPSVDSSASLSGADLPTELAEHTRYHVLELIGKGGMGDVYRAEHRIMQRAVALKVIKRELMENPQAVERFEREVRAAASLTHPNIVAAYDAEQAGDIHFLAMEYVEGTDLAGVVKQQGQISVADACEFIRQAAEGLQHAHGQGMVHRDIKPHNLMLTDDGTVKILDFGLASLTEGAIVHSDTVAQRADLTAVDTVMGTPDYIAPEQATDAHSVDIRADIYSLGCTFYTLLAGEAPFGKGSVIDKIKAHTEQAAPLLSDFRDDVPADLEKILQRMMAKGATDRYQTPAAVAAALEPWAATSTVGQASKPVPHGTGTRSYGRRRALAFSAVACLFIAAFVAAIVFYIQTDYGVVRVEVADENLEVELRGKTIVMKGGEKLLSIRAGDQNLIVRHGDVEFKTDSFQLRRGGEVKLKVAILQGKLIVHKDGQRFGEKSLRETVRPIEADDIAALLKGAVFAVNFDSDTFYEKDGKTFVRDLSGNGNDAVCNAASLAKQGGRAGDGLLCTDRVFRGGEGEPQVGVKEFGDGNGLTVPRRLIGSSDRFTVAGWVLFPQDVTNCSANLYSEHDDVDREHDVRIFLKRGYGFLFERFKPTQQQPDSSVLRMRMGPELFPKSGWTFVASAYQRGRLRTYVNEQTASGKYGFGLIKEPGRTTFGNGFNMGDSDGLFLDELVVFDRALTDEELSKLYRYGLAGHSLPRPPTPTEIVKVGHFTGHDGHVFHALVSPDGRYGISCGSDKMVRVWNIETQKEKFVLKGHEGIVFGLAVAADGKLLASSDKAKSIRLWDLESGDELAELTGHEADVTDLAFMPDGTHLVSCSFDETLRLWNVKQRKLVRTIDLGAYVEKMEPLWDAQRVMLSGAHTGGWGVLTYDLEKGEKINTKASTLSCLAVSADRRKTLIGSITGLLKVRDMESGELIVQMADPRAKAALDAAISPDGRFAVTTTRTRPGTMHLWNLNEGRLMTSIKGETIGSLSLSPDGRFALTLGRTGGVGVWRMPEDVWAKRPRR